MSEENRKNTAVEFEINRVFKVSAGTVTCVNENMGLKSNLEEAPADEYNFGSL